MNSTIRRRLVLHIGGYDPTSPQERYRRFAIEQRRFETAWSVRSISSEPTISEAVASWQILTRGCNWQVETDYRIILWDDVLDALGSRSMWWRIPSGFAALLDFMINGAFWGYLRTNWRYALYYLYPIAIVLSFAIVAFLVGVVAGRVGGSAAAGALAGVVAFAVLLNWPGRRLHLSHLLDLWIFSRTYVKSGDAELDKRLDHVAATIRALARGDEFDEIVIIGHSLGAVLAVDLVHRVLRSDPIPDRSATSIALVTIGSSVLKIALHRGAARFRDALARIGAAQSIFWVEYQALTDVMNFYKVNPLAAMSLPAMDRPIIRIVRIREMLDPARYRRVRRNFLRLHNQFVRANDRRAAYDYFMLVCGPLSAESLARAPDGAMSAFDDAGALFRKWASQVGPIGSE